MEIIARKCIENLIMIKIQKIHFGTFASIFAFFMLTLLLLVGCQSGNASDKNEHATGDGSITEVTAERFSGKNDKIRVRVTTEGKTQVTIALEDGTSKTRNCNNQCQQVFNKVDDGSGTVTVTHGTHTVEVAYAANR